MRTMIFVGNKGTKIVWQEGKFQADDAFFRYISRTEKIADLQGGETVYFHDFVQSDYVKHDQLVRKWILQYFERNQEEIVEQTYSPEWSDPVWTKYEEIKGWIY